MRFIDLFSLSTRAFKTNTSRTLLTVLGLGIGIGTVFFLVSLGYGLQNIILNKITTADSLLTLDVSVGSDQVALDSATVDAISKLSGVVETSPVINLSGQIIFENETADGLFYLVDKPFFRLSGINLLAGKEFSSSNADEVVVSSAATKIFGFDNPPDIIGKTVKLSLFIPTGEDQDLTLNNFDTDYKVVGVISGGASNVVYFPIATVGTTTLPVFSDLKVKVENTEQLNQIRGDIIKQGFLVSSISDTIDQTKKIFKIIQIVLGIFGLIALIVSAIGMFNTMTITLMERTKEIGIMRAIGVGNRDVSNSFLLESVIMGLLGGVGGVTIGYVCGEVFNIFVNFMAKNFGGQSLNLFYRPAWFTLFILGFSTLTGFLTGLYPAFRASKINPLDALRYK
jgi:ABC-type antimicrobial peptide transport system permease subunit